MQEQWGRTVPNDVLKAMLESPVLGFRTFQFNGNRRGHLGKRAADSQEFIDSSLHGLSEEGLTGWAIFWGILKFGERDGDDRAAILRLTG